MTPQERKALEEQAMAADELLRRYNEERIKWYKACSPKHEAFHASQKPIRVIFGGNRSGKSVAGLVELLFHACFKTHPVTKVPNKFPGKYRIFTTKFQIAEELIIPMLKEWVPKKCLKYGKLEKHSDAWDKSYDSRYHILHLVNGSYIDILTYDQDSSVAESVAINGAWMDEEAPERMYSGTITRLISTGGFLILTVTPLYSMSWAMKFLDLGPNDPTVDVFKLSIHDNPHLPQEYVKQMIEQWPEHERAARENGDFLEFAGKVYKELDPYVHLIAADAKMPKQGMPVVMAMDPHPRKATVITWAYVTQQDDVVFFDELEIKGTAKEIVDAIRKKEAQHKAKTLLRIIDPAAKAQGSSLASQTDTLREFEKEGMGFSLADNSEAGYNIVHEYLSYDKSRDISSLNRPRCYFTKNAPLTWYGMDHLLWDEWRFKTELKDEKERVKDYKKDFPDCVRYTLALRPTYLSNVEPVNMRNKALYQSQRLRQRFLRNTQAVTNPSANI